MEQWKDIKGFEGFYQISSLGNVRSLDRSIPTKRGFIKWKGRILVQNISPEGYNKVGLWKSGKSIAKWVHRLIAESFIENPQAKAYVNHINGNKLDNRIDNLEWSTPSENNSHKHRVLKVPGALRGKFGKENPFSKTIICLNDGNIYYGISEASRELGLSAGNISGVVSGKILHTKGYVFKEYEMYLLNKEDNN